MLHFWFIIVWNGKTENKGLRFELSENIIKARIFISILRIAILTENDFLGNCLTTKHFLSHIVIAQ